MRIRWGDKVVLAGALCLAAAWGGCAAAKECVCVCPPRAAGGKDRAKAGEAGGARGGGAAGEARARPAAEAETPETPGSGRRVGLTIYMMSKCRYAARAMTGIAGALARVGARVRLRVDYIVSEQQDGELVAMHGESELRGNIIQLCARAHYPSKSLAFLECQSRDYSSIPSNWERCAREAGMSTETLGSCMISPRGKRLLRESMDRAKKALATGSPTIYLGGSRYEGGRSKIDFLRAICAAIADDKPAACAELPPEVALKAIVLSDSRCKECRTAGLIANLKQRFFSKLDVTELDYHTSEEARRLYRKLRLKRLPALLLEQAVEGHAKYSQVKRWLVDVGRYKRLKIPAPFDPTAEVCDNGTDDTGNGRVDCADRTCRRKLVCRKERARQLDLFVMSLCPYGNKALLSMKEVLRHFRRSRLRFNIHYIAERNADGSFNALHGQPEVEENIRQLCARRHYRRGDRYLEYIWCRSRDYRSKDWRRCARGGIKAAVIARCARSGQGRRLLARSIKEAEALGITGSPTWLANNLHTFEGLTAEAVRSQLCKHNKLPGCDKTLSDDGSSGSCQ